MAKSPHRPDLVGRQRRAFHGANPLAYARVGNDAAAVTQLVLIERRAAQTKVRARAHFHKYEETWVAKEAIAIWQHRAILAARHPTSESASPNNVALSIMTEARRNVRARMARRLARINAIRTRMENAVVRSRTQQPAPMAERGPAETLPEIFRRRNIHR